MAVETKVLEGIAALLAANSIGTWSKTTAYTPTQVGIYDGPIGSDTPEAIGLTLYPVSDPVDSESIIGLQIMFQSASKSTLRDRAETVFNLLHASWGLQLPQVRITHLLRRSSSDLGRDDAGRWLRSDNYYLNLNRPTANRP